MPAIITPQGLKITLACPSIWQKALLIKGPLAGPVMLFMPKPDQLQQWGPFGPVMHIMLFQASFHQLGPGGPVMPFIPRGKTLTKIKQ